MNESVQYFANKCRHFNGIQNKTCKADIRYADVRMTSAEGPYLFPCLKDNGCSSRCTSVSYYSEEEAMQLGAESDVAVEAFVKELNEGKTCPHCHKPITELYQVGRCVYNRGCGCRQYQGVVPKHKRTKADQDQIDEASMWAPLESES